MTHRVPRVPSRCRPQVEHVNAAPRPMPAWASAVLASLPEDSLTLGFSEYAAYASWVARNTRRAWRWRPFAYGRVTRLGRWSDRSAFVRSGWRTATGCAVRARLRCE